MKEVKVLVVLVAAVVAAGFTSGAAWAQEAVAFSGTNPDGTGVRLTGFLASPKGPGPFPAVILLHCSSGLGWEPAAVRYRQWSKRLVEWGYVALLVDSYGPRGFDHDDGLTKVLAETRAQDADAARAYLDAIRTVDKTRVGVLGWSHGAMAILYLVDAACRPKGVRPFKAAVMYYPIPGVTRKHDTPTILFYGDQDAFWSGYLASEVLRYWSKTAREAELKIVKYPGATHNFDIPGLNLTETGGDHMEYNPAAAADSIEQVRLFFAKYLGAP